MSTNGRTLTLEASAGPPGGLGAPKGRSTTGRLSFGHVMMIVAALLTFVLVLSALRTRGATVKVAVAAHEIAPGATVGPSDLRYVSLPAHSALVTQLVRPGGLPVGSVAVRRIGGNEPLTFGDLRTASGPSGLRTMSIPVDPAHAVGGTLAVGDHADVVTVDGSQARYVLRDVQVVGVASTAKGGGLGLTGGSQQYFVTVALDDAGALRLAAAIRGEKIEVVRSTGAPPAAAGTYDAANPARG